MPNYFFQLLPLTIIPVFIYTAFTSLRKLNYKEETVFDIVLLNAVFIAIFVVFRLPHILLVNATLPFIYVKKHNTWNILSTIVALASAFSLFFSLYFLILLTTKKGGTYLLPFAIALFLSFVVLSNNDEAIKSFFSKINRQIKRARKITIRAKKSS